MNLLPKWPVIKQGVFKCLPKRGPPELCGCEHCLQWSGSTVQHLCRTCGVSHQEKLGRHELYQEDIWRTVYWIFKHTEDEKRYRAGELEDKSAPKIFLLMDIPEILRKPMESGRRRNLTDPTRDENLMQFENTIREYIDNDENRYYLYFYFSHSKLPFSDCFPFFISTKSPRTLSPFQK